MFTLPDADSGLLPFNVYYADKLNAASAGTFTPTSPYVYLLDAYTLPKIQRIDTMWPQVVIEIQEYRSLPYEMGNRDGRVITAWIHVFGQSRGQRDDLASFVVDYIGATLPIKTFSANNTAGTIVESALIDPERVVTDIYTARLELELSGGLMIGHSLVEITFRTKL